MNDNLKIPCAPRGLKPEKAEEVACEAFCPMIETIASRATLEGGWPSEAVHRALLAGVVNLLIDSDGIDGAMKILEEEIEILRQGVGMPIDERARHRDGGEPVA